MAIPFREWIKVNESKLNAGRLGCKPLMNRPKPEAAFAHLWAPQNVVYSQIVGHNFYCAMPFVICKPMYWRHFFGDRFATNKEKAMNTFISSATIVFVSLTAGCSSLPQQTTGSTKVPSVEAAVKTANTNGKVGQVQSPATGKTYRYYQTDDQGAQVATRQERRAMLEAAARGEDVPFDDSNVFKGVARAHAKTTLAHAKLKKFSGLDSMIATIPTDEFMLNYDPPIDQDTPRVKEELINVGVCAWIVATKNEDDNDYHIMLSNQDGSIIFNAEMSGIPPTGSKTNRKKLFNARAVFEAFVEKDGRRTGSYTGWGDAMPVYVEGSLFFDSEHKPGKVGPAFARPKSSWEIHPISKIVFEPEAALCNN
jgi:hypothetical protein